MTHDPAGSGRPSAAHDAFGSRAAVQRLWQENRRWIASVLLAHKPRTADLEDLLQDVAMTLVAKINTLRDHSNVRAWLRVVAVNAARAAARSQRSSRAVPFLEHDGELAGAGDRSPELNEHTRKVMDMVAQLPDTYREPLLLKAVHGMRTRQIAEILEIEEAAVDTRICRARRMLRQKIEHTEQDSDRVMEVQS